MGSRKLIPLILATTALPPVLLLLFGSALGQQVHRNFFESKQTSWNKGTTDATYRELAHEMTDKTAHTGQLCEFIQLNADKGNFIHYYYPTSKAPICEELSISLWVKANRPGAQLMARLVLPRERDPHNLDERLTALLPGSQYQTTGFWQRLDMRRPAKLALEQQQLMQAKLQRPVDFTDAYIDRLMLQAYSGPGLTEVWIDDLEMSPVVDNSPAAPTASSTSSGPAPIAAAERKQRPLSRAVSVELHQDHLVVDGKPFLFRGIRYSDTPLPVLRSAGFNALWVDSQTPRARLEDAINIGFKLVPSLPVTSMDARLTSGRALERTVEGFPGNEGVLFWDLGGGLMAEQSDLIRNAARQVHAADPRPLGGDVWDGFVPYSRSLDLVGVHRWPLMTMMELPQYRDWLNQRRLLCRPDTFTWTWVQTHLPDWYTSLVSEQRVTEGLSEPVGPLPEQIRLLTYVALAAGARGLAYWSDRSLADSTQGRDRLLALALLNQEMQMLEPFLLTSERPRWIETSRPEVLAAVMRGKHGVLALPMWIGGGAQFVPGQSAAAQVTMIVPEVPAATMAWEVSPADIKPLEFVRVASGYKVTLRDFGLTRAVIFTADNSPTGLLVHLQDQARSMRRTAAQWAVDLAKTEMDKVLQVHDELQRMERATPDSKQLIEEAKKRLTEAESHWKNDDFRRAYAEGERCLRPLRILMRAHWEQAVRRLDTPVSSPYAVSYFTLPRHWQFVKQIAPQSAGANVLPDGDFEVVPSRAPAAWSPQEANLDNMDLTARRVTDNPKEGQQCLKLQIAPPKAMTANGKPPLPPQALERTYLAINSPAVRMSPGTLVRISFWVRIPDPIAASADGALFYDSGGGEPLAVRLSGKTDWKQYTIYRWVPASGLLNVTMALTGIGTVYFDDVRIEPLHSERTVAAPVSRPSLSPPAANRTTTQESAPATPSAGR